MSHAPRRPAKFEQHAVAQSFGIALAGLCKIHDPPCQHFVGEVAAISKPKCDQGHFKCRPMTRIVSESNLWPSKWGRIGMGGLWEKSGTVGNGTQ